MSPEQRIEELARNMQARETREDRRIVQFQVIDDRIYVLRADGTLWVQRGDGEWMELEGP